MTDCSPCSPTLNGFPFGGGGGGGGGGGTTIPAGAVFWSFASDGGPPDGIITTTDATPFFRTWASLPVIGATVNFYGMFTGVSTDGTQCLFRMQQGGYGLDAAGDNTLYPFGAVSNSGYDELGTGMAPWNNLGPNPAGWNGGMNFTPGGNIIQVAANGAVGRTVNWSCLLIILPYNGAVIFV